MRNNLLKHEEEKRRNRNVVLLKDADMDRIWTKHTSNDKDFGKMEIKSKLNIRKSQLKFLRSMMRN